MDERYRDLERRLMAGDIVAALPFERLRRQRSGPRQLVKQWDRYYLSINQRRIQGELEIIPLSNEDLIIDNLKAENQYGGWGVVPLEVNNVPYSIRFRMHNFPEYGWIPSSVENLMYSQREREEAHRNWDLNSYLLGYYDTEPNISIRRLDVPISRSDPTPRGREMILELMQQIAETWPLQHPQEMRAAHKAHLNNEIIEISEEMELLNQQLRALSTRLANAIIDELD